MNHKVLTIVVTVSLVLSIYISSCSLLPASAYDGVFIDVETCEMFDFISDLKHSHIAGEPVYIKGKTQNQSQTREIFENPQINYSKNSKGTLNNTA